VTEAAHQKKVRSSPCDWAGELPDHWAIAPLYARYKVQLGKMLDEKRITGNHLAPYLRNVDVQWDRVNSVELPEMDFHPADRMRLLLRPGDLLVCEGGEAGRTALWRGELRECYYQKAIHRLRPRSQNDCPRFFYYVMFAATKMGVFVAGGNPNTFNHLTAEKLRQHRFPFPPLPEQKTIADFLDRKSAQIDGLIAKKQRQIELLGEKRQALISQAVTKGLDPKVPMKDSGIPWLGTIPAHWEVERLRWRLRSMGQGWSPQCEVRQADPGEWGVLKVGCMNSGAYDESENKALPPSLPPVPELEIKVGDVLMSRSNTVDLVGMVGMVHQTQGKILLCDKLYRLVFDHAKLDPNYAVHLLRSHCARLQIEGDATGASSSMKNISNEVVSNSVFAFPPLPEQNEITEYLGCHIERQVMMERKIAHQIGKLGEYRQTLISAAVTGKIETTREAAC